MGSPDLTKFTTFWKTHSTDCEPGGLSGRGPCKAASEERKGHSRGELVVLDTNHSPSMDLFSPVVDNATEVGEHRETEMES